jgi:HEAT repeat protein
MAWQKGQSGNPGGRPKEFEDLKALARTHTEAAIAALAAALENPRERVAAATALLDRGYGKPHQTSSMNVDNRPITEMTTAELLAIAAQGRTALAGGTETEH